MFVQGKTLDGLNMYLDISIKELLKFTFLLPYGIHPFHKIPTVIDGTNPDLVRTS